METKDLTDLHNDGKNSFPYSDAVCGKIVKLPAIDFAEIARLADEQNDSLSKHRFGKGTKVSLSLDDGHWTDVDGGRLWTISFKSENALSLNFVLKNFHLIKGAKLYITNYNKHIIYGPVTSDAIAYSDVFLTDIIKGNEATIYLFEPLGQEEESTLTIAKVVQGFKEPYTRDRGTTQITSGSDYDVACYPEWEEVSDGVAFIIGADGETSYSGSLLMSTDYSFRPFVLTDSRCLKSDGVYNTQNASNLFFKFRAKKATCGGTQEAVSYSYNGSACRADSPDYIFALLEISHDVKLQTNIAWLGWDRSTTVPSSACSMYNGSGDDLLKLAFDYDNFCSYQGDYWQYHWPSTYYVGNKNGAPLLNLSKRVIGYQFQNGNTLTIHNGALTIERIGIFEKMSSIWTGGGTNSSRLCNWLDPIGTNQLTMDSYYPMIIQGATYPCGEEVYNVSNLPNDCTVTWSIPGASTAIAAMLQSNSPQQNQCTITNSNNLEFNTNLVAQVKRNGTTILTLNKNIRHFNFSGSYFQMGRTFNGITYPDIDLTNFGNNGLLIVNQNCFVIIHSPCFASAGITYSGVAPTILTSPNDETIRLCVFSQQAKAVTTVNVTNGTCYNYQFTIWAYKSPYLPNDINDPSINVSRSENGYTISLLCFVKEKDGSIVCSYGDKEWDLQITNSITGDIVFKRRQTDSSCTVNTIGWKPGIYVVTGVLEHKVCTSKISINK